MIAHRTVGWPAVDSYPTSLPGFLLRRNRHPIELATENCATVHSSLAPANRPGNLTLGLARSPFRIRYLPRSVSLRSQLYCGLGSSTSRRFQ
jgi:hypothetical protein